ncbi:MAG TPA: Crp/Fnr family transcriptional regulator [Bacillota bacterium]
MSLRRSPLQVDGPLLAAEEHPLFRGVERGELERFLDIDMRRGYRRGMYLFVEDEPVDAFYCILGGRIKAYATGPDGRQQILGLHHDGHLLPYAAAFYGQRNIGTAEVVRDTVALRIPIATFRELLLTNRQVLQNFAQLLEQQIVELEQIIRNLSLYTVPQRVARVLAAEAREHGEALSGGFRFRFPFTQQELAQFVGTTRESVSRTLAEFRRSGVLRPGGRGRVFLDMEKLQPYL